MSIFPAVIAYHTKTTNHGAVAVMKMKDLCTDCAAIGKKATENNVNLLIFVPHHGQHITTSIFYSYACPLLEEKFPQTLLNTYDRRTWVYLKEKDAVATNSMICGSAITDSILREKNVDFEVIPSIYDLVLIKNNVLPTDSLLKVLNIDSKRHTY